MEQKQNHFEGWAVVEMFGHAKEVGFVTTESYGVAVLFRVDTPSLPEREFTLESPEYIANTWTPAGSKVKRPASPAKTRMIGPGAIYAITPCTEETAMKAIEEFTRRPLILLELAKDARPLLPDERVPEPDFGETDAVLEDEEP